EAMTPTASERCPAASSPCSGVGADRRRLWRAGCIEGRTWGSRGPLPCFSAALGRALGPGPVVGRSLNLLPKTEVYRLRRILIQGGTPDGEPLGWGIPCRAPAGRAESPGGRQTMKRLSTDAKRFRALAGTSLSPLLFALALPLALAGCEKDEPPPPLPAA